MAIGLRKDDATLIADTLVQADLWGHPSHGVMRTFWYMDRLLSRATDPLATPVVDGGKGALAAMDGCKGMGQVVAKAAMQEAIRRAADFGIGAVAVRNSGHFGTAMYFTRMAAQAGMVGFLSTNASPAMAPWGGMAKQLGTNPWSWAAPAGKHPPMMLDISNTAVARGKLFAAAKRGDSIPEGWAIDEDGRATTDPEAGISGTILPMAGHKGYGISALVDVLSGVLSGSAFGPNVVGPYVPEGDSGAGHLVIAIDISAVRPLAEFEQDMEILIRSLKSCPRADGVDEILYPGEPEHRHAEKSAEIGIQVPESVLADLKTGAEKLGLRLPF